MEKAQGKLELITRYFADLSATQLGQLEALDTLYTEWNAKINVISRKDIDSLYEKHVLHSLSIAAVFDFPSGSEVIDIGTGGGFPGIPLAIFFPEAHFHLVDSIGKKIKVAAAVADTLQLHNVTVQHIRAEEIRGRKFDVAVSRAVAPLKELLGWSRPLLKRKSMPAKPDSQPVAAGLICLKGGDLHAEISESGSRPGLIEIFDLFPEPFFREKFLVQVI